MFNKFMRFWHAVKYISAKKDRHNMKDRKEGIRTRERLALIYAFITWNTFGIAFYLLVKEKLPTDRQEKRASLFKLTGAPGNLYIYQMQGLEVKDNLVMKSEEIDEDLKVGAAQ